MYITAKYHFNDCAMEAPLSNRPAHPDFEVGLSSIYVNGLERSYLFLESAVESLGKLKRLKLTAMESMYNLAVQIFLIIAR